MELPEERRLQLSAVLVVSLVAFENLVEPFEQEGPELVERSKVAHTVGSMNAVMVIRLDHVRSI